MGEDGEKGEGEEMREVHVESVSEQGKYCEEARKAWAVQLVDCW